MNHLLLILILALSWAVTGGGSLALANHEVLSSLLPGKPLVGSRLFLEKDCIRCHAIHGVGGV
ncbi:MAG: hypothetical protein ACE5JL_08055, partial [Dehalococcoidia bacterium]